MWRGGAAENGYSQRCVHAMISSPRRVLADLFLTLALLNFHLPPPRWITCAQHTCTRLMRNAEVPHRALVGTRVPNSIPPTTRGQESG